MNNNNNINQSCYKQLTCSFHKESSSNLLYLSKPLLNEDVNRYYNQNDRISSNNNSSSNDDNKYIKDISNKKNGNVDLSSWLKFYQKSEEKNKDNNIKNNNDNLSSTIPSDNLNIKDNPIQNITNKINVDSLPSTVKTKISSSSPLSTAPVYKIPDQLRTKSFVESISPHLIYLEPEYSSLNDEELGKKILETFSENSNPKAEATKNAIILLRKRGLRAETVHKYQVGLGIFSLRDSAKMDNPSNDNLFAQPSLTQYACLTFPWICKEGDFDDDSVSSFPLTLDSQSKPGSHKQVGGIREKMEKARKIAREHALKPGDFFAKRYKIRALENKAIQRTYPAGGGQGLFGYHLIDRASNSRIIITEGEFDAMIVHQETGENVVSLPNGARSFPPSLLGVMDRFSEIVLWMDNDEVGMEGCEKIAAKLFPRKVLIVSPTEQELENCIGDKSHPYYENHLKKTKKLKDANDYFLQGYDIQKILDTKKDVRNDEIVRFSDFKQDVAREFDEPDYKRGSRILSFPTLHNILRGHRRGELTIFSGPTGAGKTTFLSQLSLDICRQGVPTLWGSFEIRNPRLVSHMIQQFAYTNGRNFVMPPPPTKEENDRHKKSNNPVEAAESEADKLAIQAKQMFFRYEEEFSQLPLYFMNFFGATSADKVISTMEAAAWNYDIEHVILDNLQFMIGSSTGQQKFMNRFDIQDDALGKFRSFCTKHNVHMTLVIHPRKESEAESLTTDSIFGTAKATQEADNLLLLQKKQDGSKYIDVKKNRFSGDTGSIKIAFHKPSRCFSEATSTKTKS